MAETPGRILVCDDEKFFREAIRDILTGEALDVVEASDGETALELAADTTIGVAILDVRLPGINGLEVLCQLRESRPELRVIMLSAHTDQEIVIEALRLGACDYLAKPLHDEELVLAVRRAAESFRVSHDWGRLRGRVDRLAGQLEDLSRRAAECEDDERRGVITRAAADAAALVLEAEKTSLMLMDDEGSQLCVVSAHGRSIDVGEMDAVPVGQGVAGAALERGEPTVVTDVESDERFDAGDGSRYDSRSFVVAPVGRAGQTLGVLCATDRAGGGVFDRDDLGLLRLLANQVAEMLEGGTRAPAASALQNGESPAIEDFNPTELDTRGVSVVGGADFEEREKHEEATGPADGEHDRGAEMVRAVCEAITEEVAPERIFAAALRPLADGLAAAPASIFLIDAEHGVLRLESSCDGGRRDEREELPTSGGLTGSVFQSGQMVASDTPSADGRFSAEIDTPLDGVAGPMLCVPLSLRGKVIGVFRAFAVPRQGQDAAAPAALLALARSGELIGPALSAAVRNALLYRSLLESIDEVAEARRASRS